MKPKFKALLAAILMIFFLTPAFGQDTIRGVVTGSATVSQGFSVSPEYTICAMTETSYTIGTRSPERTSDTTKVWKEDRTTGKPILNTYLFCGVDKWESNKIACYKKNGNAALVIVDTMATIRLFYLDILEKQKEIDRKNEEINALQDLTTSVWYNPQLPENKKYLSKLKKYNKQFGWNFRPYKSNEK